MNKIILPLLFLPLIAFSTEPSISIKSIEGSDTIQIQRNNSTHQAHPQDELQENDKITTDAKTTAEIVYRDGSSQVISPSSQISILPSEQNTPASFLENGTVVIQVPKNNTNNNGHKFFIRTNTAVMGVRGTLFVVDSKLSEGGKTTLHTLEGQVEMAKDQKTLQAGKATMVRQNEMLQASRNNWGVKSQFNPTNYLNQLQRSHPMARQFIQKQIENRHQPQINQKQPHDQMNPEKQKNNDPNKKSNSGLNKRDNDKPDSSNAPGKNHEPSRSNDSNSKKGNGPGQGNGPGRGATDRRNGPGMMRPNNTNNAPNGPMNNNMQGKPMQNQQPSINQPQPIQNH